MNQLAVLSALLVALVGSTVAVSVPSRSIRKIDWSLVRPISEFAHVRQIIQSLRGDAKSIVDQRIVGGNIASAGQIPYQVAILADIEDGWGLCGGALISTNYVLTAAVCVNGASEGTVILGAQNLQNENEAGQVRVDFTSSDVYIHEEYVEFVFRNNIAMVRLPQSVSVTERIRPAVLPAVSDSRTFSGMQSTVSGFGRTSDASTSFSDVLRYVSNPILTNADCSAGWYGDLVDGQKMCLAYTNARGPCVGDVGGPLTVQDAGQSLLVGLFSFGYAAGCESQWPSVFVRVTFYLNWIASHTDVVIRSN